MAPFPSVKVRVQAIITADNDGTNSASSVHPHLPEDKAGAWKYRIEPSDIAKLVQGANDVYAAANIKFVFDSTTDVKTLNDSRLRSDTLSPASVQEFQRVVFRDVAGHLQELTAGVGQWQGSDLTKRAAAPLAAGPPATYLTNASAVPHVVYRGVDGHVHELWADSTWNHNSLTVAADAPNAAGEPFGYTSFDPATGRMDVQHVVYRGVDGHVHELFAGSTWMHNALTVTANAPKAAGDPFGYTTFNPASGRMDVQHVVYRGVDGHVYELVAGADWRHNSLTAAAGAPAAAGDPFGYTTNNGKVQHVIYRGVDGQIHELFAGDTWRHNDLTSATGAADAAGDPSGYLTDHYETGVKDIQHVVYRGVDGHLHELYTSKTWQHNDLTHSTGVKVEASSDPTGYTNSGRKVQHVVFRGTDGDLHQFSANQDENWTYANLTEAAGAPAATSTPCAMLVANDTLNALTRSQVAQSYPGRLVVFFRWGPQGFSGSVNEYMVMPNVWDPSDLNFLAHEMGHYFHLAHSHYEGSPVGAAASIKAFVENLARTEHAKNHPEDKGKLPKEIPEWIVAGGLEAIDNDRPGVTDTAAEILDLTKLPVKFATGQKGVEQQFVYGLPATSDNLMSYLLKVASKPRVLSAQQIARVRNALDHGNRRHLVQ